MHCAGQKIQKYGKKPKGVQRFKCKSCNKIFQDAYVNNGAKAETKALIIKMSVNGNGIRDIARVLSISPNTVLSVLKKQKTV